jgi:hypothetical protein
MGSFKITIIYKMSDTTTTKAAQHEEVEPRPRVRKNYIQKLYATTSMEIIRRKMREVVLEDGLISESEHNNSQTVSYAQFQKIKTRLNE